jgi:membrane fusion protein, multidrug efflux system
LTETGATTGPGAPVFEVSGTEREIVVQLAIDQRELVVRGDTATIVLPDDLETPGTITSISNVALADPQTGRQTVEMTVAFDDPGDAAAFEQAAVNVEVVSEQVLDALLAPVEAVLALAEGGYAIEVVEGDASRLVAVQLGKFADGLVEITGEVQEGDLVAIPR